MADWGNMPKELVTNIAEHLHYFEDFITLRCVCSTWRSAFKGAKFRARINNDGNSSSSSSLGREHTIPWLIYPRRRSSAMRHTLFSFYKHKLRSIKLPLQQRDYCNINDERVLTSHGWLMMVLGHKLSLYNPLHGATIELPEVKLSWSVHHGVVDYTPIKLVLSANPSTTSDFIVFLTLEDKATTLITLPSMLVYWRNGSGYDGWIQVVDPDLDPQSELTSSNFLESLCRDITFYQGEFYGVNTDGKIVKFETAQGSTHFRVVTELETFNNSKINETRHHYLVESAGKLLVICQVKLRSLFILHTIRFEVLELDVRDGNVKEVTNLGNRAIFTGSNSSFSVEVPNPAVCGFRGNSIFYLDDRVTWKWDMYGEYYKDHCFYNMVDGLPWRFCQLMINTCPLQLEFLGEGIPCSWIES